MSKQSDYKDDLKPTQNSFLQKSFMRDKQALAIVDPQPIAIGKIVANLFKNPTYMLSVSCITNLMFVIVGL
jgi:hypothetical protein